MSALRNLGRPTERPATAAQHKGPPPAFGSGPVLQRLSCLSGPFPGTVIPHPLRSTIQRQGVEWQWKVRDESARSRPRGIRVPCWGTLSGRRGHHRCAPAALKTFCRLPGATPGWKPGGARSAPLHRVYRAQSAFGPARLETHADSEADRRLDGKVERTQRAVRTLPRRHNRLTRLGRYRLLVVDEVGYVPLEPEAPTCSSSS